MRKRSVLCVLVIVAAAHWAAIFSPWKWSTHLPSLAAEAPQRMDTVWVTPAPRMEQPPPQSPAPSVQPTMPPKQKFVKRQAANSHVVEPVPVSHTVQDNPAAPEEEAQSLPEAEPFATLAPQAEAESTGQQEKSPSGPSFQALDAMGDAVPIIFPGGAPPLQRQMLLRFKVHGFVDGMEYHANAELEWTLQGDQYQARQSVSAFLLGSMEQRSSGSITPQGLQPLEFSDRRLAKRRMVHFDWLAEHATFDPPRAATPIGSGAQDRLSVFLQLAALLKAMPELRAPGTRLEIPTLGSRRLQMWVFVVQAQEQLELPAGSMATLRLQRLAQAGDSENAQLWVNLEQGFVPARIRIEERNGDVMDFSLKS